MMGPMLLVECSEEVCPFEFHRNTCGVMAPKLHGEADALKEALIVA